MAKITKKEKRKNIIAENFKFQSMNVQLRMRGRLAACCFNI
jgi:hypothetical protein